MLQFYLYLFFCFLHLVLEEGEEDVKEGPRSARASHRLSEALCLGSTLVRPGPSVLAKRRNFLLVRTTPWLVGSPPPRPMVGRLLCCLCLQNPLCVWTKCLLACSGAACCRKVPRLFANHRWDPIVGRLNAVPVMRRRIIIMMMVKMKMIIVETQLSAGSMSLWWGCWKGFGWPYYWWWEDFFCCYFLFINTTKKCFQFSCLWNKEKFSTTEIMHSFPGHFCNMWNWF